MSIHQFCAKYSVQDIEDITKALLNENLNIGESLSRILKVKEKIKIFRGIEDESSIAHIIKDVQVIRFKANQIILKEGSTTQEMYFILSGICNVIKFGKVIGEISPGSSFGEIAAIFNKPRNATIEAQNELAVIKFSIDHTKTSMYAHEFAILYRNIASELVDKLESQNKG
jgi:CRP-like cAMP-binding protein